MSHYVRITRREKSTDPRGTVYLLHFEQPFKHAKHYLGWTGDLDARLAEHDAGRGSSLMAAVVASGIAWSVARLWPDATRMRERQLKNRGSAVRLCPICKRGAAA